MIRLTGGALRGRRIEVPPGIRPTTEMARKAAFDALGREVEGARVLDAAAGSGAMGFEALSRDAGSVLFVEKDPRVARLLRSNADRLEVTSRVEVVVRSVADFLVAAKGRDERFDLVFHDPPYGDASEKDLAGLLALLAPGGVLVHERGDDGGRLSGLPEPDRRRRYGSTWLLTFRR